MPTGDLVSCKKIVKGGKADDINRAASRFFHGDSPFHQACRFGHLSVVSYLLSLKCKEHLKNIDAQNALMLAAMGGHLVRCLEEVAQQGCCDVSILWLYT